ncbi:hypothetical protein BDN70DRAFT_807527 [Pholiota conissans]|uniref:Uncharacterized protein n=1 Tax=Pholiota conissans TaxID=109636 RepID=A0A9P5Z3F6_9AGAR|nr:hypothetical protein BDN70DRAFT_807527 [Pholiota conissans]
MRWTGAVSFVLLHLGFLCRADIVAFTGTQCDGNAGSDVACDGSCHSFSTRHSFQVGATGSHCVTAYLNANCDTLVGVYQDQGNSACVHVNTGTSVQSFRCASSNTCVA